MRQALGVGQGRALGHVLRHEGRARVRARASRPRRAASARLGRHADGPDPLALDTLQGIPLGLSSMCGTRAAARSTRTCRARSPRLRTVPRSRRSPVAYGRRPGCSGRCRWTGRRCSGSSSAPISAPGCRRSSRPPSRRRRRAARRPAPSRLARSTRLRPALRDRGHVVQRGAVPGHDVQRRPLSVGAGRRPRRRASRR